MIIFSTRSAQHLLKKIELPCAQYLIKQFSDGELYVKINQSIQEKVWIIAGTQPPAENLLELFFLLDALTRLGVKDINIVFTYFGYARQSIALPGEACSAQFICDVVKKFPLGKVHIVHAHAAPILHTFLTFTNNIDLDFFCTFAKQYDAVAAPDKGAAEFAQQVAQASARDLILMHKIRPEQEHIAIESVMGNVRGKRILLVDDIIATGRTVMGAAQELKKLGALEVAVAAMHGIFSDNARQHLEQSDLTKIYVTNTINQSAQGNIEVIDVSAYIKALIVDA